MSPIGTRTCRPSRSRLALAVLTVCVGALVPSAARSTAAPASPPRPTSEPVVTGSAEQGRRLSASRGSWTGSAALVRVPLGGPLRGRRRQPRRQQPHLCVSGSDGLEVRPHERGRRLPDARPRHRDERRGLEDRRLEPDRGRGRGPVNTSIPIVSGTALVDSTLTVQPGSWSGRQPITFAYAWLRCNTAGGECAAIAGATGRSYRLTSADVDHKLRVNVTARNAIGRTTVLSSESGVVGVPLPPGAIRLPGGRISIPVTSVPADQRLVVSQVGFTPNPVASRRPDHGARAREGHARLRRARRARLRPLDAEGDERQSPGDGDGRPDDRPARPARDVPLRKQGHVQFFVKAYRSGDPPLAGVAAYRLVQVRTANV